MNIQPVSFIHSNKYNAGFTGHKLVKTLKDPNYSNLKISVYKLDNGQTVTIIPKKGPDAVTINSVVKTGSLNEIDSQRGISHFMEHLAFDGSKKGAFKKELKPREFDKMMEGKGARINAHTTSNLTSYFVSAADINKSDFRKILQAHAQMIKNPALPEDAYKKEQAVVIQEIKQTKDNPFNSLLFDTMKNTFGIKSSSSHLVIGEEANIANMKRSDVFNYHKLNYTPDNIDTFIIGDVNPEEAVKIADEVFDTPDFKPNKKKRIFEKFIPIQKTAVKRIYNEKLQQPVMLLGFTGPLNGNQKEQTAAEALNILLSAKLKSGLEQHNIKSEASVYSGMPGGDKPSLFMIIAVTEGGQEQKALDLISETIKEIKDSPVSDAKLHSIKKNLLNDINKKCETSRDISEVLEKFTYAGSTEAYALRTELIKNLTAEDIQAAAKKYLDTQKTSITILDSPEHKNNKVLSFKGMQFINSENITRKVFSNGAEAVFNDNPNTIRASFVLMNEKNLKPYRAGAADILADMLNSSTKKHKRQELAELLSDNAIDIKCFGTASGLKIKADCMTDTVPKALDTALEMMFDADLSRENFEKAKINTKLMYNLEIPDASSRLDEASLEGTPYINKSVRLRNNNIDSIAYEEVCQMYRDMINKPVLRASFTAPLSSEKGLKDKIAGQLEAVPYNFSAEKKKPAGIKEIKTPKVLVQVIPNTFQSEIMQRHLIKADDIKTKAVQKVISAILSGGLTSRLFIDLREQQKLAYQVYHDTDEYPGFLADTFVIKTGSRDENGNVTDNIRKSIEGFEKHKKMLIDTPVSEKELKEAKKHIKTSIIMMQAKAAVQNLALHNGAFDKDNPEYFNEYFEALNNVTPEDIQKYARKYYTKPSVTSIVTDKESAAKAGEYLKMKGAYKYYTDWKQDT